MTRFRDDDEDDDGVNVGEVVCIRETDLAILVRFEQDGNEVWFPKSTIHHTSDVFEGDDAGALVLQTWFAEEKGFA